MFCPSRPPSRLLYFSWHFPNAQCSFSWGFPPSSLLFFCFYESMCSSCMATTPSPPKKSEWHTRVSDWEQRTKCRLCPLLTHPTSIGTPGERALEHQSQQLIIHTGIPLIHLVAGHKPNSTPGALPLPICRSTGCFKSVQCTCTALRACWLELGLGSQRQREYKSVHLQPLNASQKLVRNPEPGAGGSTLVFK